MSDRQGDSDDPPEPAGSADLPSAPTGETRIRAKIRGLVARVRERDRGAHAAGDAGDRDCGCHPAYHELGVHAPGWDEKRP